MIVSNATPLINFAAIQRLDILERLFEHLVLPKAVEHELFEKGILYPSAAKLKQVTFLEIREVQNVTLYESLNTELNEGEAEAIALALELKATLLLIDEVEGRLELPDHTTFHSQAQSDVLFKRKNAGSFLRSNHFWMPCKLRLAFGSIQPFTPLSLSKTMNRSSDRMRKPNRSPNSSSPFSRARLTGRL